MPTPDVPPVREPSHAHGLATALRAGAGAMRRHPGLAALLLGATLAQGVLQGLLLWALRDVLLWFTRTHGSASALVWGALLIFGVWLARVVCTFVGEVAAARLAHRVEIETMREVLAKLLTLSVRYFERSSQGDLVMAAYQDLKGIRTVTLELGTIVLALSRLVGLVVVAWMMSPMLALVGLVVVPLGALPAHRLGQRITNAARFERDAAATLFDSFLQVASGIRVIKVNRAEERVLDRARGVGQELYRNVVRQAQARSIARVLMETASGIGLVVVLVVGGQAVAAEELEWQALLSLLIAVMAVYGPILSMMTVYNSIRAVIPHLDRGEEILRTLPEVQDAPDAQPLHRAPTTITLEDVAFGYDDRLVLDGISVTFHAGETIGIVGPSGSGKSTLMALLLRLYDPTRGRILFDGVDLRALRHADVMDQCAIVPQEPFLFVDTIANNIRFTRPEASLAAVIEAAKAANIHDEIALTERGYDTMLGRHRDGRGLSGGQRQRLCIAAAVLKNAPILFLDEATSSLDSVSECAVQAAIERLMAGRTSFVIAHRLSTLRSADRILVLDEGRLVGIGRHEELLTTCPTYQRLWQLQVGDTMATDRAATGRAPTGHAPTGHAPNGHAPNGREPDGRDAALQLT